MMRTHNLLAREAARRADSEAREALSRHKHDVELARLGLERPVGELPLWAGALIAAWFICMPILAIALVLP